MNEKSKSLVFVSGNFNILHPGHLRFLKFAAEQGDRLIVGLFAKNFSTGVFLSDDERSESLKSVAFVDDVVLIQSDLKEHVLNLKPSVVVKGREFEGKANPEKEWLAQYGGTLLFGSGEVLTSTSGFVDTKTHQPVVEGDYRSFSYSKRHEFEADAVQSVIDDFSTKRIAVVGDTIVDKYIDCDPVGMSREDVTLVVSPRAENKYLGGAGIVAGHAAGLGAKVDFYTLLGEGSETGFAEEKCAEYGVNFKYYEDPTRPTTSKTRFRAGGKTLLRVNDFRQHSVQESIRRAFISDLSAKLADYDLVVFSDFSYGFLSYELLEELLPKLTDAGIPFVADSQSSSQIGDLMKFKGALLVTPTEHEARQAVKNHQDGLIQVSEQLGTALSADHVLLTQGEDGVLVRSYNDEQKWWDTDDLPAMNKHPQDVAGAGDAMMIATSLSLICGADIWLAAFLGSIASAVQVSRVGNVPIQFDQFKAQLHACFPNGEVL